jgi:Uma2 family endonuclease
MSSFGEEYIESAETVRQKEPLYYSSDKVYTYSDYLLLPDEECYYYEILDGYLIREPAPTTLHQRVSYRLHRLLDDCFWERDPDGEIFCAPVDLTLSDTNVVQPDLVYVPGGSNIVEKQRINGIPHLVVEVISPSTRSKDYARKAQIYARLGVPHYWIIDPEQRTFESFRLAEPGKYSPCGTVKGEQVFTHPDFPGLAIQLDVLWRKGRL